jgi:glycine cleavage system H protein
MIDPKKVLYTTTHEWVLIEGDMATVGISRFAVDQLTDLILIDLPKVGKKVSTGKGFGEIESVKAVSDLYSPVDGEVTEVNSAVAADVQILAQDPFDKGWLIKVKLSDPKATIPGLLGYDSYTKKVADSAH